MLLRARDIINRKVLAADGEVGRVKDVYFDDATRIVRYIVVDTGTWLDRHEVLLAPSAFTQWGLDTDLLATPLTRKKVEDSPPVTADMPVSRQYEQRLHDYYGWQPYWSFPMVPAPGLYMYPAVPVPPAPTSDALPADVQDAMARSEQQGDPHLRSFSEVKGYHIKALDGEIGHVDDLLIETEGFRITHLVVDTRNWLPGKHVIVDAGLVEAISWEDGTVSVRLDRAAVKSSPAYDPSMRIDEGYQTRLSSYYRGLGDASSPHAGF